MYKECNASPDNNGALPRPCLSIDSVWFGVKASLPSLLLSVGNNNDNIPRSQWQKLKYSTIFLQREYCFPVCSCEYVSTRRQPMRGETKDKYCVHKPGMWR